MKSINELLLSMTDKEYFEYRAVHHSELVGYDKYGFEYFKRDNNISSPSLIFGSLVDCMLTSPDEMKNLFYVSDIKISETIRPIIDEVYRLWGNIYNSLDEVNKDVLESVCDEFDYCMKTKISRVKKLIENGKNYYKHLKDSEGKTVIGNNTYLEAVATKSAILNNENTRYIFGKNTDKNVEIVHQAIMRHEYHIDEYYIPVLVKFDALIVNHKEKIIIPVDLKTTGKPEYDFYKSYLEFGYDYQSKLYCDVLKNNISKDEYFSDFTISKFIFVVINKTSRNPMLWYDSMCNSMNDYETNKGNKVHNPIKNLVDVWRYKTETHNIPIEIKSKNELFDFI